MEKLRAELERIVAGLEGRVGVCVRDVKSGEEIGLNADELLPMASTCKVPILIEAYRRHEAGKLDLAERVEITEATRCLGSGLFNAFDAGLKPTVHDLLLMMIVVSDNAATDMVLDRLTPEAVTATMRALGLKSVRVDRPIRVLIGDIITCLDPRLEGATVADWDTRCEAHPGLKERSEDLEACRRSVNEGAADRDIASARDLARLCAMIALHECAGAEACEGMLEILNKQQLNGRLPRDLPPFTKFPHKTGTLGSGAVVNDAGILYLRDEPVAAVAVLSRDLKNPIHETNTALANIGRAVYEAYNRREQ